jgi:hypothetical protein
VLLRSLFISLEDPRLDQKREVYPNTLPGNSKQVNWSHSWESSSRLTNCTSPPDSVGLRDVLSKMPNGDILFSYGNRDYLPHHLHWVCNTGGWPGVHERTLIIVDDQFSKEAINHLSPKVSTYISPANSQHHGFYSKGYRKLTIYRLEILIEVLKSGRGVIMFEGDALWTRNIFEDPNVGGALRIYDAALYRDGINGEFIGAGILFALTPLKLACAVQFWAVKLRMESKALCSVVVHSDCFL